MTTLKIIRSIQKQIGIAGVRKFLSFDDWCRPIFLGLCTITSLCHLGMSFPFSGYHVPQSSSMQMRYTDSRSFCSTRIGDTSSLINIWQVGEKYEALKVRFFVYTHMEGEMYKWEEYIDTYIRWHAIFSFRRRKTDPKIFLFLHASEMYAKVTNNLWKYLGIT